MLFQNGTITMRYIHMNDHICSPTWILMAGDVDELQGDAGGLSRWIMSPHQKYGQHREIRVYGVEVNLIRDFANAPGRRVGGRSSFFSSIRIHLVRDPGFTSKPYSSTRGRPSRSLSFFHHIFVMKQDLHLQLILLEYGGDFISTWTETRKPEATVCPPPK